MVPRANAPPKTLDAMSCAPSLLTAKADKAISIDKHDASNLFDIILLNLSYLLDTKVTFSN